MAWRHESTDTFEGNQETNRQYSDKNLDNKTILQFDRQICRACIKVQQNPTTVLSGSFSIVQVRI